MNGFSLCEGAPGVPKSLAELVDAGDRVFQASRWRCGSRRTRPRHRAHRNRGTEGSNPSPSSGESAANLTSSIEREAEVTIRWLWTEERVSHKGRFYAVNDAGIGVKERGIAIRLEPYRPAWCRAVH